VTGAGLYLLAIVALAVARLEARGTSHDRREDEAR
jgi:hypothetical protein